MRVTSARLALALVAAIAVVGIARAQPQPALAPADAARLDEKYVIQPGAESLFSEMLGNDQTLPGGCTLGDGQIERTAVVATYACGGETVVLELLHPEVAPSGGVRTQRFAITVKSGSPPPGFVEAIADRIRARESKFQWTIVDGGHPRPNHGRMLAAAAAAATILAFVVLRRLTARR